MHKNEKACSKEFNSLLNSLPFQGKETTKGFTLVELIVVITILAILGTIAFISLQSYSANARDSVRVSDLGKMNTALELFHLDSGKYPETSSGFIISYSGSEVWTQGIFGEATLSNVDKLNKIPLDPLTEKEYTYSVTKTRQEYQFAGIMESDGFALNSTIGQTNAGDNLAVAVVTGTYNGQTIKTQSGTNCNILSLPSIISSEANNITDLSVILNNESLVYNGYKNLPTNYISSKYKTDGGFAFTSHKLVVYNDAESCAPLYNPDSNTARIEMLTNLQEAYSGTIIKNEDDISGLVNIDLTNTTQADLLSITLINNNLGGDITIPKTISDISDGGRTSVTPVECSLTQTQVDTLNGLTTSALSAYDADFNELNTLTENEWCNNIKYIQWFGGSSIPDEIWNLTNLIALGFDNNFLTSLPAEIGNLTNLTFLGLGGTSLTSLPAEVWTLTSLNGLYLNNNSLTTIPAEIGKLTNLTELHLGYNSLESIPAEIGKLTNLTNLRLYNNSLTTIPTEIGKLTNLNRIRAHNNSLESIPAEIGKLINLNTLILFNNSLESIPAQIGDLTNLNTLYLSYNSLTTIPAEIKNLNNLVYLYLGNNSLLGNLSFDFGIDSGIKSQLDIPTIGQTMIIGGNGTNIVITITP